MTREATSIPLCKSQSKYLDPAYLEKLNKRHFQGALVRSGASMFMLLLFWISMFFHAITPEHITGIFFSVVVIVLMNIPCLCILKHIKRRNLYDLFSLFINAVEILCYTAIIYFLGGIRGSYFTLAYAIIITYTGAVAPRRSPFIVAGFCSLAFSSLIILKYIGFLPGQVEISSAHLSWPNIILMLTMLSGLLFVVAFTSAYTASLLKRNREKLRQRNTELEESRAELALIANDLQEKNMQLKEAMHKAMEADRAKSEFLANMSHELRTPLNHIIGFTELIVDQKLGDLNETQEEYLNDVLSSSRHLLSLINDILDLSKIEAGKLELELSDVDVSSLLTNSLIMVKEKALKHSIDISMDIDEIPEIIEADERKLKRVMYNLLSNAVKYTPDGGKVKVRARLITEQASGNSLSEKGGSSSAIEISVSDTGIGIKNEDFERIFNPFEQGDGSSNRKYQGTGLGLSLTKKLVELHGGEMWTESEGEGKGSIFNFIMPLSLEKEGAS